MIPSNNNNNINNNNNNNSSSNNHHSNNTMNSMVGVKTEKSLLQGSSSSQNPLRVPSKAGTEALPCMFY